MESLFSSLGIEWKMLLAQIINFGILAFVLTKLVYKPLMKALEDREQTIKKISEDSSKVDEVLREAEEKQNTILEEARKHGEKINKESETSASNLKKSILDEAKADAERIIKTGQKKLEEDQQKFYAGLKTELVGLVNAGIEQTVSKYIDKDAETKLKQEALSKALEASSKMR